MQWSRPHQEKSKELGFFTCEYADSAAASKGDVVIWGIEGAPLSTDMTGTPIPGIYGPETKYLTGFRVFRANNGNSLHHGRLIAGVLDEDVPAVSVATLTTRIHRLVRVQCWGPAEAKVDIATTGSVNTPLINAFGGSAGTGDGAFMDDALAAPIRVLSVGAFLTQPVTPPYQGLARVFLRCV
jgi:hypothetical protein